MIIDLAVDSQNDGFIGVGQGLGARLCEEESMISHDETPGADRSGFHLGECDRLTNTDDAEALMAQDSLVADQASAYRRMSVQCPQCAIDLRNY
jgi:hypothetical protein